MISDRLRVLLVAAAVLAVGRNAPSAETVEAIPAGRAGKWVERDAGHWGRYFAYAKRFYHGRRAVAGLGFEVTVSGGWPRVLGRSFLEHWTHGHRKEAYGVNAGFMDLGEVRTSGAPGAIALSKRTWCYREYGIGSGADALEVLVSRLTPAVLFTTQSRALDLFAGPKAWGREYENWKEPRQEKPYLPKWVAFARQGGVVVAPAEAGADLKNMSECWMLFWFDGSARFYRPTVPLIWFAGEGAPRLMDYLKSVGKRHFTPANLPVLVVFQRRPQEFRIERDGVRFAFGGGGAGTTAMVPVFGFHHPLLKDTDLWQRGLPAEVVDRCRKWAARMKHVPLTCSESYRVQNNAAAVSIVHSYTYREVPDDWGTKGEKIAPVSPAVGLAARYGFPVELSGPPAPMPIPTHSGPYTGVAGADSVTITISGLGKYVNETVASPPATPEAQVLVKELRAEIGKMARAGVLAPAVDLKLGNPNRMPFYFVGSAPMLQALAEAYPYLDEKGRASALDLASAYTAKWPPLMAKPVNCWEGPRREYYRLLDPDEHIALGCRDGGRMRSRPPGPLQLYPLWRFARATGRWDVLEDLVRDQRDLILSRARRNMDAAEWATCGYFYNGSHWNGHIRRGGVEWANGEFSEFLALARIARRMQDADAGAFATYRLAKTALRRAAQGRLIRYMYDEEFQTIDVDPDWPHRVGGMRSGRLWPYRWADEEGDVRQVLIWDEAGPAIAQIYADLGGFGPQHTRWIPVFSEVTPELARFLGDHVQAETRRFVDVYDLNCPYWHITRRMCDVGTECSIDDPRGPYGVFLVMCYGLGADGADMLRRQDIPYTRIGDLFHIEKLAAGIRALGGVRWERIDRRPRP